MNVNIQSKIHNSYTDVDWNQPILYVTLLLQIFRQILYKHLCRALINLLTLWFSAAYVSSGNKIAVNTGVSTFQNPGGSRALAAQAVITVAHGKFMLELG